MKGGKNKMSNKENNKYFGIRKRDGTGPEGKGPRTGKQMGTCKGAEPKAVEGFDTYGNSKSVKIKLN